MIVQRGMHAIYIFIITLLVCNVASADLQDALSDKSKKDNQYKNDLEHYYIKEVKMIENDAGSLIQMYEVLAMCHTYALLGSNGKNRALARRYSVHHDALDKAHAKVKGINLFD